MFGSIGQTSSSEKPIALVARIKSRGQEAHGLPGLLPPVLVRARAPAIGRGGCVEGARQTCNGFLLERGGNQGREPVAAREFSRASVFLFVPEDYRPFLVYLMGLKVGIII